MIVHLSTALRQRARLIGLLAGCATSLTLLSGPVFVSDTFAQTAAPAAPAVAKKVAAKAKPKPKPIDGEAEPAGSEASRDGNAAWRDYDAGVQLLRSAQPEAASEKFSKVIAGSNVPAPLMAKTLLQRGIAYRQEGKPGQAVADLTSAMYLRNGLSEPEKADATAQRSAAYREAGLTEQGVAQPDQGRAKVVASGSSSGAASLMAASSVKVPTASLAPGGDAPDKPSSGGTGGFFSKLFGSSDSTDSSPPPIAAAPSPATAAVSAWSTPEATAVTGGKAAKTGAKVAAVGGGSEILPWEKPAGAPATDSPAAAKAKAPAPRTVAAVAAGDGAKPSVSGGKFRLQLAAVMSREEAQASAARVKSQFGADIGSRAATIDEAALGSSTMYIVRFGPYASAAEIKALCTRIRATGMDCLQAP
jgi:SPOR domain